VRLVKFRGRGRGFGLLGTPRLLKGYLFLGAVVLAAASLLYSNRLARRLEKAQQTTSMVFAKVAADLSFSAVESPTPDVYLPLVRRIDFPVIFTDINGVPRAWRNVPVDPRAIDNEELDRVDPGSPPPGPIADLMRVVARLDRECEPIPIYAPDSTITGFLHYGRSPIVRELSWVPWLQIGLVTLFVVVGFIGFLTIRRGEEDSIWVGLAKETAHQLGTPLSALLGWLELVKEKSQSVASDSSAAESLIRATEEMGNDVRRMQRIVSRFSKIGSPSKPEPEDIEAILRETVEYFRKRVPRLGKEISIIEEYHDLPAVSVDGELLSWALENLVKNSLDAIEDRNGLIRISAESDGRYVHILINDSGRGMTAEESRRIFLPGYSTKHFGWGLGLPLVKRIVEQYHRGRIYLVQSRPGGGSTFVIDIPVAR
jgi:signal transduction histidine kinase